jgi:hypothetical protein
MRQPMTAADSGTVAQFGDVRLVCHVCRKTLFWGFLLASLLCCLGLAGLVVVLRSLLTDPTRDVAGSLALLAVAALLLWGGWRLGRKANRLRSKRVIVYAGGLSYHDGSTCLTCRWDQIADIRWSARPHYEHLADQWGNEIPGTTRLSHISNRITVRRKDGVAMVFTDELENIVGLAGAIQRERSREVGYH